MTTEVSHHYFHLLILISVTLPSPLPLSLEASHPLSRNHIAQQSSPVRFSRIGSVPVRHHALRRHWPNALRPLKPSSVNLEPGFARTYQRLTDQHFLLSSALHTCHCTSFPLHPVSLPPSSLTFQPSPSSATTRPPRPGTEQGRNCQLDCSTRTHLSGDELFPTLSRPIAPSTSHTPLHIRRPSLSSRLPRCPSLSARHGAR
jgi:hypothetical protein